MRWRRFTKATSAPPSPRRLAAAKRSVARDQEANALTPELVSFTTAEARVAHYDKETAAFWQRLRNTRAANWREARAALRALPPVTRRLALRWWNNWQGPADPEFLLDRIRAWHKKARLFSTDLANMHRLRQHRQVNDSLNQSQRIDLSKGLDHIQTKLVAQQLRIHRRLREHTAEPNQS